MKHLLWFVSDHGFGHAARSAAVMGALLQQQPALRITVITGVPEWFFTTGPGALPVTVVQEPCDTGLVQRDAFTIDFDATIASLNRMYPVKPEWMSRLDASCEGADAAVCDISPAGGAYSLARGIPFAVLSNFSWPFIYRRYAPRMPAFTPFIRAFESLEPQARLHIVSEPFCELPAGALVVGPVARPFFEARETVRQRLGIETGQPMVLITMGGIDTRVVDRPMSGDSGPVLVFSGGSNRVERHGRVIRLPHRSAFYHPDLTAAADLVVGKLGYSTLAEAAAAGTPLYFTGRDDFEETAPLAAWARERLNAREIAPGGLDQAVESLTEMPVRNPVLSGGREAAARLLSDFVDGL